MQAVESTLLENTYAIIGILLFSLLSVAAFRRGCLKEKGEKKNFRKQAAASAVPMNFDSQLLHARKAMPPTSGHP